MAESYVAEEYKALRAEIIRNMEASERNIVACLTANGVALAYGVKESQPFVLFLACAIPFYFWIQHTIYRQAIAKIAAYIATFIENPDIGLMWENRLQWTDRMESRPRLLYALKSFLLPYPILALVSVLTTLFKLGSKHLPMWSLLAGSVFLALGVIAIARRADVHYVDLRANWRNAFMDTKDVERKEREVKPELKVVSQAPNTSVAADG